MKFLVVDCVDFMDENKLRIQANLINKSLEIDMGIPAADYKGV